MNRFILAEGLRDSARYMCDQHIRKMIVEEAQMLSTVVRAAYPEIVDAFPELYASCYEHHPCTVWAGLNQGNWRVAYGLWLSMSSEYLERFGGLHGTYRKLAAPLACVEQTTGFSRLPRVGRTPHPQCFGDHTHLKTNETWPVRAYRMYYVVKEATFKRPMTWTRTPRPAWLDDPDYHQLPHVA